MTVTAKQAARNGVASSGLGREDVYEVEVLGKKVLVGTTYVPISKLVVDDAYQRDIDIAKCERFAANWDDGAAGLVTVSSRENGTYAILDGQHRVKAQDIRREKMVWCEVFFDLDPSREAYIFDVRNSNRTAINALGKFKARLSENGLTESGKRAQAINKIVELCGFQIGLTRGSGPNRVIAIQAMEIAYDWGVLAATLSLIRLAWPKTTLTRNKAFILAVGALAWHFGDKLDKERWERVMATAPVAALYSDARSRHATLGKPDWQHLARLLAQEYDKRLRKLDVEGIRFPTMDKKPVEKKGKGVKRG